MVVIKLPNGDKYDGDWEDDMKNGQGTYSYARGGSYEGEWADDMRNGYGVNKWPNGDRYAGKWQNNKRNGKGKYFYADGGKYDGEWKDDMRNGHGVNIWANGNRYEGSWVNNLQHGDGTMTYPDGGKYEGEWSKSMRDGHGVNTWSNNERYEGSWKRGQKHGKGTLYHADGSEETGVWANDELNGQSSHGAKNNHGEISTTKSNSKNKIQFKGFWLNGQPFLVLLLPKSSGCSYQALGREYVASLKWDTTYFDNTHDRCYCSNCYKDSWKDVIEAGDSRYVIPRGWTRVGLHIDPVLMKTQDIWNKWIVTFHGTTKIAAQSILTHRQFCLPGDVLIDGTKLGIRPGHIPNQMHIYTSPTIAYSSGPAYSPVYNFHSVENDANYEAQIVLQCRQMPNTFKIGPETIGAKTEICEHIPNSEIEYFTDRRASLLAYGLLVRFRQKNN
jgi:hypothetical protein